MHKPIKIAYLVSHPIQYQAPMLRRIAREPGIDLLVLFCSDFSVREYQDPGFGRKVEWDVPLLEGYEYKFLPSFGDKSPMSFWWPWNFGLLSILKNGDFDVLWVHGYARLSHLVAIIWAKILGIKVLVRGESTFIGRADNGWREGLVQLIFKVMRRVIDGFLAIGSENRRYYLARGVNKEKVFFMPYAVDNDYFRNKSLGIDSSIRDTRSRLGLEDDRPIILYASKLTARKNILDLLSAYQMLSSDGESEPIPYLLIVGDGDLRCELEGWIENRNWSAIKYLGFKNQSELPLYYALCDVFVLPSESEPWGLVVNEVMNAGAAVIVSNQVGCASDLVRPGINGYIFPLHDVNALTLALKNVLATKERSRSLGRASIDIINKWGFDQDVAGIKDAIRDVHGVRAQVADRAV